MSRLPIRTMLFAGTALALGGGTLVLGQGLLQEQSAAPVQAAAPASRPVLVATRVLVTGSTVKPGDLAWRVWPVTGIDPSYIVGPQVPIERFAGNIVRREIQSGEPITAGRLAAAGAGGSLAAVTGPGKRAVSVALTPTSGVSGLIVPGDRVDVVLTYAVPQPADASGGGNLERRAATTILSDLKVLAVDQRLAAGPAEKDLHNASLEVTAKQSEVLALAADIGKLSLSLRSLAADGVSTGTASGSTIDYQIGRLLPGLGSRGTGVRRPRASGPRQVAAVTEFRGGRAAAQGTPE